MSSVEKKETTVRKLRNWVIDRGLVYVLCFVLITLIPTSSLAASYTINGVTISHTSVSAGKSGGCWAYANAIYKKIWGTNFTCTFSDGTNLLKNLNDAERKITAASTQRFITNAKLGSSIRIASAPSTEKSFADDSAYYSSASDSYKAACKMSNGQYKYGHSMILVAKNSTGFTFIQSAGGVSSEKTYTWAGFANAYASKYVYFKYIKAPKTTPLTTEETTLSGTFVFIRNDESRSQPYETGTLIKSYNAGDMVTVVSSIVNTYGNTWYKTSEGTWVYSGDVDDVTMTLNEEPTITSYTYPSGSLTQGQSFGLRGTISCKYPITELTATVTNRETDATPLTKTVTPNSTKYTIAKNETINNALKFGTLGVAYYNYSITAKYVKEGVSYTYQVLSSDFTVGTPSWPLVIDFTIWANEEIRNEDDLEIGLLPNSTIPIRAYTEDNTDITNRITWSSSDSSVATISTQNQIIMYKAGKVTISGQLNGITRSFTLIIYPTSGTCGVNAAWSFSNGVLTISGSGRVDDYNYSDSNMMPPWSSFKENVTSVIVGEGITCIGTDSFSGFVNMNSVSLPGSLNVIANYSFYSCSSLTSILLPSGVTTIGSCAFLNCSGLSEINIPNGISTISSSMLEGCTSINRIIIPSSVKVIDEKAFYRCSSLTAIVLPNGLESLGRYSFQGCTNLRSVTARAMDTVIGGYCFADCPNLIIYCNENSQFHECALRDSNNWNYILIGGQCGENATWSYISGKLTISGSGKITDFANIEARPWHSLASDITTVIIEPGITHIGEYCFESFTSMTSVTIPNTVTYMAYRAFYNCDTLQNISLPNLLTGIGSVCFMECGNLQSINMPDTVTTIGYYTFKSCTSLADVHLSTQLSAITYGSFADCSSLSSIVIPDSVTKIGYRAFEGCQGLRSITIPVSVSAIDVTTDVGAENAYGLNTAFSGCSNVTIYCFDGSDAQHYAAEQGIVCVVAGGKCGDSLTWRKDGKELIISGTGAMYDYTYDTAPWGKDITSVSFSEGVTSIGYCAFYGCTELRSVSGHPSITSIGPESFKCCSSLSKFNIGSNVKTVNSQAFAWCSSLTYVSIPASVEYIGEGAFCYCESLETIIVDSTNTHYYTDDSALLGKDGTLVAYLTTRTAESYTIPDGIKRIGAWCFANAKNIKTLTASSSVVEFRPGAVENSGLTTIMCFEDSTAHTFAIENNIQYILMDSPLINPDLVLPAGTKYIEEEAFAGIAAKRIKLPEGVTEIEANAFSNCPNLKQIYIPDGCERIATTAFEGATNLTIYGMNGSYAQWYASRQGFTFKEVK